MHDLLEEQHRVMGRDPWVYGIEPNRKALEAMHRCGQLCGLVSKPLGSVDEWFYPSTRDETPGVERETARQNVSPRRPAPRARRA